MTTDLATLLRESVDSLEVVVPPDFVQRSLRSATRRRTRRRVAVGTTAVLASVGAASLHLAGSDDGRPVVLLPASSPSPTAATAVVETVDVDGVVVPLPPGHHRVHPAPTYRRFSAPGQAPARVTAILVAPDAMTDAEADRGAPGLLRVSVVRGGPPGDVSTRPLHIDVQGPLQRTGKGVHLQRRLSPTVVVEVIGVEVSDAAAQSLIDGCTDSGHDNGQPALDPGPS